MVLKKTVKSLKRSKHFVLNLVSSSIINEMFMTTFERHIILEFILKTHNYENLF